MWFGLSLVGALFQAGQYSMWPVLSSPVTRERAKKRLLGAGGGGDGGSEEEAERDGDEHE
jgi:hypothetical protein